MSYSLLSRFEGCLWGVVLGEHLGRTAPISLQTPATPVLHRWLPAPVTGDELPWSCGLFQDLQQLLRSLTWNPSSTSSTASAQQGLNAGSLALLTLPVALFYHDDLNRQRHFLAQRLNSLVVTAAQRDWVMVYAYAIAQALKGQLDPTLFIEQLLAYLQVIHPDEPPSNMVQASLQQIKLQIKHQLPSDGAAAIVPQPAESRDAAIAIALRWFLLTPDSFPLAIVRAAQVSNSPSSTTMMRLICPLAGALAGAYNGVAAIPASWCLAMPTLPSLAGQPISDFAAALLAHWSGFYDLTELSSPPTVAAPWVMRLR